MTAPQGGWPDSAPQAAPPAGWPAGPGPGGADPGLSAGGATYPAGPPASWPAHAPAGPTFGGASPVPPDSGGRGRTAAVITVVGVVLVLAIAALAIGSIADGGSEEAGSDTTVDLSDPAITAPPSEDPIGPTMPSIPDLLPPTGDLDDAAVPLEEVLASLIDFVEVTRGQQFVTEPVVQAVAEEEFEDELAQADAGTASSAPEAVTGIALGSLPPGTDLDAVRAQTRAAGVFGFYDPSTQALYVKGDLVTPYVQSIIVHELVHALDDQVVGLAVLDELTARPDEQAFAFLTLVEGSAEYVRDAFVAQLGADERAAYDTEQVQRGFDQLPTLLDVPPVYLVEQSVPYAVGLRFVQALVDGGGTAAIDAAYADPPTTSEQVLDVAVYEAREPAVELRALAADGTVAQEGAFGAADLRLLDLVADPIAALMDPEVAALAPVDGFGGGRFVSWSDGDLSCIRFEVVGDDAAATADLADMVDQWATAVSDAEVGSRTGSGGVEVVTAERCA